MENGPFVDGLPIKHGGSFHGYVSHNQMVSITHGLLKNPTIFDEPATKPPLITRGFFGPIDLKKRKQQMLGQS
jgi:hypothetical protein